MAKTKESAKVAINCKRPALWSLEL